MKIFNKSLFFLLIFVFSSFLISCTPQDNTKNTPNQLSNPTNDPMAEAIAKAKQTIPANITPDPVAPENVVYAYYYQKPGNPLSNNNADCTGSYSINYVTRQLNDSDIPAIQAMRYLLSGNLTDQEKEAGFIGSPFSNLNFAITDISLKDNGELYIDLKDENVLLQFDECWGSIFSTAIFRTAEKFPEVKNVKFEKYFDVKIK